MCGGAVSSCRVVCVSAPIAGVLVLPSPQSPPSQQQLTDTDPSVMQAAQDPADKEGTCFLGNVYRGVTLSIPSPLSLMEPSGRSLGWDGRIRHFFIHFWDVGVAGRTRI